MGTLNEREWSELFAAGARSVWERAGGSEKDAEAFVLDACKEAAARRVRWDEDEEDEGGTWWSRNKHWALPTAIGAGAFLLGANSGRGGRPDRGHFSNAGSYLLKKVRALLGFPDSPMWDSLTNTHMEA